MTIKVRCQISERLLCDISVWHDFDWFEVMRHNKTVFPNCKWFR